jgi:hypothetical protein
MLDGHWQGKMGKVGSWLDIFFLPLIFDDLLRVENKLILQGLGTAKYENLTYNEYMGGKRPGKVSQPCHHGGLSKDLDWKTIDSAFINIYVYSFD